MKAARTIAGLIFILTLPVLFLSASIAWGFNSYWIYDYGFRKYDVSQATGLPPSELEKVGRGMIAYWNSNDELVQFTVTTGGRSFELFNAEEQAHLKDVKQLVRLDYRVLIITLILGSSYAIVSVLWRQGRYRHRFARDVVWGSGLTLGLIAVVGTVVLLAFDWLWLQFHFLAFTNEFWSAEGYMIPIFGSFWYNAILITLGFMAALAVLLGVPSVIYLRLRKTSAK